MYHAPTALTPAYEKERPRRRRRAILAALLGLTTLSLGAGMFSLAIFTDTDTTNGTFAAGTINIESSPTLDMTVPPLLPGDSVTGEVVIDNLGTGEFRYAMTTVASGDLAPALQLEIRDEGTDCATFDGNVVRANGALGTAAFGNPLTGNDTGDRVLAASGTETLCFQVTLPLATDNTYQGDTAAATFTFAAEQTANN